jgi:glutamate dehydrogenase/leucine dehydrogenase
MRVAREIDAGIVARAAVQRRERSTWRRYAAFLRRPPELSLAWHDAETGARAWLIINSQRGGAAGGGTRMRLGLEPREVTYLAKAMELKFALAGPPIGGAKTGIDFDPADPRRRSVLERWWRSIRPLLRERYGTGGDLNVDEVLDVLPIFDELGLGHPQEGVVRGHLQPDETAFRTVMRRMGDGVEAPVRGALGVDGADFTVADMITGYGVAASVRHFLEKQGRDVADTRVLLEGFGNVGAACAVYLARAGARIVAVCDARHTLLEPAGLDAAEVETLVRRRNGKTIPTDDARVQRRTDGSRFWSQPADVFVCAAISESISETTLARMQARGVGIVACGANQPFQESKIGSTRIAQHADHRFAVLPDIVANCGMARTFSYLMENGAQADAAAIVAAVERTIAETLDEVLDRTRGRPTELLAATVGLALDRIGAP